VGKADPDRRLPRTGSAWTSTGEPYELRGLKYRPDGAIRIVPIPPILVTLLRQHRDQFRYTPDGRLFHGTRGGMLSESLYGRVWHAARSDALGPALASTSLARRPYDLRHAALSLWLTASMAPAEVAVRAGNSVRVLHTVYTHCLYGQEQAVSQQIEQALRQPDRSPLVTASGPANRLHHPGAVRYLSVRGAHRAARHQPLGKKTRMRTHVGAKRLYRSEEEFARLAHSDDVAGAA